jgi:tetratricopeptide (TPR) repeat protein
MLMFVGRRGRLITLLDMTRGLELERGLRRALLATLVLWSATDIARSTAQNAPPPPQSGAPTDAANDGQQLFMAGRYPEAERAFATACERNDREPQAWAMLGRARKAQSKFDLAIQAFERADALQPNDPRVLAQLGASHFDAQQLDPAAKYFKRVASIEPGNSRAHMYLARIAVARGDDESAEREFALAVGALDPDPIAPFHQGLMFMRLRRYPEAAKAFELALQLIPDLQGAHMNLGLVLERLGRHEESERHLKRFRELQDIAIDEHAKKIQVSNLLVRVNQYIEAGNYEAALAPAIEARDIQPAWPVPHEMLAQIYSALGRKDESARELEQARAAPAKNVNAGKSQQ